MSHGSFVWSELMTTDAPAAAAFYQAVMGWSGHDSGIAGESYTIFEAGGSPAAGLLELPRTALEAGAKPRWTPYVGVGDLDETVATFVHSGGRLVYGPETIDGVGRFAYVADPQGALLTLFAPRVGSAPSAPAGFTPGRAGWHELVAADQEAAFQFYATLFGWSKLEAIDMGPMGTYQIFAVGAAAVGGMMTRPDPSMTPSWRIYFNVDAIGPAAARVSQAGGQVTQGPHPVPGGSLIVHGLDPQGAAFALVAPGDAAAQPG